MSDVTTVETIVRYLIEDSAKTQIPGDIYTYTSSSVFELSELNVVSVTTVLRNSVALSTSSWTYSSTTNKVTISSSLSSGDTIEIQYTYYSNYSSNEIEGFIRSAFVDLSINNYYTFEVDDNDNFYPEMTDKEKNLVAAIAMIRINKTKQSLRLPDISITYAKDLNVNDKIAKTISLFKHNTHGFFSVS